MNGFYQRQPGAGTANGLRQRLLCCPNLADYDSVQTRTTILGWMGSWNYSPKAPSQYTYNGLGVESIPRDLALKNFRKGIRLVLMPIPELQQIRQKPVSFQNAQILGIHSIATYAPFSPTKNVYEMDATFTNIKPSAIFGFNLCGDNKVSRKLIVKYDAFTSTLSINRTHCILLTGHIAQIQLLMICFQ